MGDRSPNLERVADNVWVAAPAPGEGAMVAVSTSAGKLVIDTTAYPLVARRVRESVDALVPGPWRLVVNTHRHFDHVGGNQAFEDCLILAPKFTREVMQTYTAEWQAAHFDEWERGGQFDRSQLGPHFRLVLPEATFSGELRLHLGDTEVRIMRLGGHTAEQSAVFLPGQRLIMASDLVFNGRPAWLGDGDRWQWLQALETLRCLQPATVIPGHGPVGGPELLEQQITELRNHTGD